MAALTPDKIIEVPIGNARILCVQFSSTGISNLDTWDVGVGPVLDVYGQMEALPNLGQTACKLNIVVAGTVLTFYVADNAANVYTIYVYTVN